MSEQIEKVLLSPHTEANRLWEGVQEAYGKAREDIAHLSESIDLGMRVVELLTIQCLRTVRKAFPTTVSALLDPPPPDVDPARDFMHPRKSLRLIDALDMLSATDLPCISPLLHHGWVDHAEICRDLRIRTEKATGISLDNQQREALMLIGAYRNRLFLLPPPVLIVPEDVLNAFPLLIALVKQLFAMNQTPAS